MSDISVIQEEPEAAPVETPVTGLPASDYSSDADTDLDRLLKEFDEKTRPSELPASEGPAQQDTPIDGSGELDALLRDLDGATADQQRADALQGQLSELQAQVRREQDWQEFTSFSDDLQKQATALSPHVDENFVRLRLESAAHNPEIALAWDTRHINPADASRDLAYVEHNLRQLQADPNADPKQVQELNKLAYQLNVAANSPAILRRLKNSILAEAKNSRPPIDEQATADHDAVAQAVREANHGDIPSPPVNFGRMTDKEFKEYTRINYGF